MATRERYKLQLKGIPQGSFQETYLLDDSFFSQRGQFELFGGTIEIHLNGVRTGEVYEVYFKLSGEVETLCTRCEDRLRYPLVGSFHTVIKLDDKDGGDGDEEIVVSRENPVVPLDELFYSFVVVSLPIRRVHPQGECNKEIDAFLVRQEQEEKSSPFASLLHEIENNQES